MKNLFILILLGVPNFANADFWGATTLSSGEIIYSTGHYDRLIVGQRGVGFITTQTLHERNSVSLKMDDLPLIQADIQLLYLVGNSSTYIFKNSKEILPSLLKAKIVKISFNSCGNSLRASPLDCLFTSKGVPYSTSWDFVDKPLNTSFDPLELKLEKVTTSP